MLKIKSIMFALLTMVAFQAAAVELTLFEKPLRTVSRQELKAAVSQAGGTLSQSTASIDTFNVEKLNVPGLVELKIVYLDGQVVMAQYSTVGAGKATDEKFRKMLVAKYGRPNDSSDQFDRVYASDGKYRWQFDKGMELVFSQEFFGSQYLTYLNKELHARMQKSLDNAADSRAKKSAAEKVNLF